MKKTLIFLLPVYAVIIFVLAFYGVKKYSAVKAFEEDYYASNQNSVTDTQNAVREGKPVKLLLPSLKLSLDIVEGNYSETTQTWNVSDKNAHWAGITNLANDKQGNTLIYGHNTNKVLGPTKDLKVGDTLVLVTENNMSFEYKLTGYVDVDPQDTKIFEYHGSPIVTLVTCTGIRDRKRKLMNFEFIKVI